MESKYFMHRIRKENGNFVKGIEVHDTLDSAIQSFHSQMKLGYFNPDHPEITFVSCMITDGNGAVVEPYHEIWNADPDPKYFMHYIRHDGETYTKDIDVCDDAATAKRTCHAQLEYGYENPQHPDTTFVFAMVDSMDGYIRMKGVWNKTEPETEPDVNPEDGGEEE